MGSNGSPGRQKEGGPRATRKMEMMSTKKGNLRGDTSGNKENEFCGASEPSRHHVQTGLAVRTWSPTERQRLEIQIWESLSWS